MKKNKTLLIGLLMLVMTVAGVTGCGTASNAPAAKTTEKSTQTTEKTTVLIQDYKFQPAEITIQKGETITWVNQDSVRHTATGKSFDSGLLSKGEVFKQTFNEAGIFDYICTPHPSMKGKVIVQ